MDKSKTKWAGVAFILLFTVMTFAGCIGQEEEPETTTVVTTEEGKVTTKTIVTTAPEKVEVVMGCNPATEEAITKLEPEIEALYPNIDFVWRPMPWDTGAQHDSYALWLALEDESVDIMWIDCIWPAEFAAAGWIEPLDAYITSEHRDQFIPSTLETYTFDGKLWAIPLFIGVPGLYYRTDLLAEFNYDPPETYDELVSQAQAITDKYPELYGFTWQGAKYEGLVCSWLEFHYGHGAEIFDANGDVVVNSPEGVKALQFMYDLIWKYKVSPEATLGWMEEDARVAFTEGKAVFHRNWPYVLPIAEDPARSDIVGKWGLVPNPYTAPGTSTATLGGWALAINKYSPDKEEAWKVVEYLTTTGLKDFILRYGETPPTKALFEDPDILAKYPDMPLLYEVLQGVKPRPMHPRYPEISDILQDELHAAISGVKTPKNALDSAAKRLADLLDVDAPYL